MRVSSRPLLNLPESLSCAGAKAPFYLAGDEDALAGPAIAIVGSRRPRAHSLRFAFTLSRELARRGYVVTSGLARGIDTAAHAGALDGNGRTVAVLGAGLARLYPPENAQLAHAIATRRGALLTEHAPDTPPLPGHFPRRNRWIAALSLGVVVIEAREKSGSLWTTQAALALGREVFVAPGAADDAGYAGSHRLLQEGAKLVTSIDDVLEELPDHAYLPAPEPALVCWEPLVAPLAQAFAAEGGVATVSELAERLGESAARVATRLGAAERCDLVRSLPWRRYAWVAELALPPSGPLLAKRESDAAQ